jgi:hypothetical protein
VAELGKKPLAYNFDFSYGEKKTEKLSDLISIETLSQATGVIGKGGMKSIPRVYATQLKEFCTEVLANIR